MPELDCRDEVFCERGHEVLGSVVQGTQMAFPDPFDVEELHADARLAFKATLGAVAHGTISRILLIRGEAGCGKTHLIRALRAQAHQERRGVIAYVHLTSECADYRTYLLRQVVRSLADAYVYAPGQSEQRSALDMISDALADGLNSNLAVAEKLQEADDQSLAELVSEGADLLSEIKNEQGRLRYADVDLNTLRVFLYRQSTRKPIQRRVSSFLNGDPLSAMDWQKLAALPGDCNRGPMHLLGQLARITTAALNVPLVICVDQIEASDITGKNHEPFVRAMSTACELIENVPGLMILLSCLDSAYDAHIPSLISSYRHRIENEPGAVTLFARREADDIRKIISRRLKGLYEGVGLQHVPPNSVYPMPEDLPDRLARQHLRDVLQQVYRYWQQCNRAQIVVEWKQEKAPPSASPSAEDIDRLRLAWNEFRTAGEHKVAEDDAAHLDLLAWALADIPSELPERSKAAVEKQPGIVPAISFVLDRTGDGRLQRLIGLCEKDPRGNGLYNQVAALQLQRQGAEQNIVIFRSTRFPRSGKLAEHLATLRDAGDICQVIDETSWQTMQALREFVESKPSGAPGAAQAPVARGAPGASGIAAFSPEVVREWRRSDAPLTGMPEILAVLQRRGAAPPAGAQASLFPQISAASAATIGSPATLTSVVAASNGRISESLNDALHAAQPAMLNEARSVASNVASNGSSNEASNEASSGERGKAPPAPKAVSASPTASTSSPGPAVAMGPFVIGQSDGFTPGPVPLDPQTLTRHTAIFGSNGSGKTVLALSIVEKLLERGVGVVLFDRKGDLATYAVEDAWRQNTGAPDEASRRPALRDRLDIKLYTPGSLAGRPLVLPMLPVGLKETSEQEREEQCRQAAMILCHVCAPTRTRIDMFATVLSKAIFLLCMSDRPHTLDNLEQVLLQAPPELLSLLPAHNSRHCEDVGRRLNERRVAHGRLFSDQGERLDLHRMLLERPAGRTPLTIISTQFLEGDASLIWIAQFLAAAGRFIQQYPSPGGQLQGLLMFDEADLYVPAVRKPICKPGMENLLRRARAAGVGIMLATQSTGDFDYNALVNVNTVFAGKLPAERAADKLQPRLGDVVQKLAKIPVGHFVMGAEAGVSEIKGDMCLVKPTAVPREEIERIAALKL